MGARPHLAQLLRDGILCAPFGLDAVAKLGSFFVITRAGATGRDTVEAFVAWLRSEVRRDGELMLAPPRTSNRSPAQRTMVASGRSRAPRR